MATTSMRKRSRRATWAGGVLAVCLFTHLLAATTAVAKQAGSGGGPAAPEDVASEDAIITALYESISGPVGQPRDWDRFRSLFVPGARLVPTTPSPQGGFTHRVLTAEDYIAGSAEALVAMGFREREIARRSESFANIVHAFSTYEGFRGDESEPFLRGINSIQLFNDGTRWWIVTIFWAAERPDNPLPDRYLP